MSKFEKLSDTFFDAITTHIKNIVTVPAKNKETGDDTLVVCMSHVVNGEERIVPFAALFTAKDNPWALYDMPLQEDLEVVPYETRRHWWQLWLRKS